jgi:protein-S-isoprenylcysteine O-methyltransferase Ste14
LARKNKNLVTVGAYRYIRHPFYSSLLFLTWKVCFINPSWIGGSLAIIASVFLILTAKVEEAKNILFQYHLENL